MVAYIVLNGERIENYTFPKDSYIIAADAALKYCQDKNICVSKSIGDFDSLGKIPNNAEVFPIDKDYTDGELALHYAIENGAEKIVFVNFGGYCEDHFLGNLNLLEIACDLGINAVAETVYSTIYYVNNSIDLSVEENSYVSVIARENSIIKSSYGLKYAYSNTQLKRASTLGISNIAIKDKIGIEIATGAAFVIVNKKRV